MSDSPRSPTGDGIACACAFAPFVHAVVAGVFSRIDPSPDPVAVVWSEHSPTLTRMTLALFVTALLAFGLVAIARAIPQHMPRLTLVAASLSAIGVTVHAWAFP